MILMDNERTLKVVKVTFVTKDNQELGREQLSDHQYQDFCNEVEKSRLKYKIVWPEFDERYNK
jgi:hypothetical protein